MQDTKLVVTESSSWIYGEWVNYYVGFTYDSSYAIPASTDTLTFTLTSAGLPTITIGPLPINLDNINSKLTAVFGISQVVLYPPGTYTLHVTTDLRSDEHYNAPP